MKDTRNLLKIGLVANLFEFYELTVYFYMADIIGQLFFSAADSTVRTIQAFAVFAMGYFARPLGSIVFGTIGDRIGRGYALRIAWVIMAVPTVLIGILPTYQEIGLLAPILLLALRVIQGFAINSEATMSACYIFEKAADTRKSMLCGVVMTSGALAHLLASLVTTLLFLMFDRKEILAWAWRIPFLLSIPMTMCIFIIRRTMNDFSVQPPHSPVSTFHALKQPLLKMFLLFPFSATFVYILIFWLPFYLVHFMGYSPHLAQLTNTLVLLALAGIYLAVGYVAGLIGYQWLIKIGLAATILLIYPLWLGLQSHSFKVVLVTQLLLALLLGVVNGVSMEVLARQFQGFVRCRGMNLAFMIPAILVGTTTPLVCTWMIDKTGLLMFPAFYILFFGLLALPVALRLNPPHTAKFAIPQIHLGDTTLIES